ncbi:3-ketodihydrosphingosine reductase tsc10 [Cytospora mali]|uniref:3-dehydrosphinganine reductase n=1 Tax=Cytospora mali TaxID=578113 RepID=A0A194V787_CYTMA|nr:3-ketodihydrosphingosine reductase tsc10 [Valsa mali var. pyri (nom. inval.)]
MGSFMSTNSFPVKGRTILITGGSRGTGLEAGRQLASKGANVVIVARDQKRLQEGIEYISTGAASPETQRFHQISADMTGAETCASVMAEVTEWNHGSPPDIVWCCAGSSQPTMFIETEVSQFQALMELNYLSSAYMAHAALRAWLRPATEAATPSGKGNTQSKALVARHLIFTSSFLALYPVAGYSPYSPSKAALRSLSDSLSQEMQLYAAANPNSPPVRVHTVFPATIYTESYEAENRIKSDLTKMLEEADGGQTAEVVARKSIEGLESGHELITCDLMTRFVMCSTLGASLRGGFWKGLTDYFLGWLGLIVMILVRGYMDRKVRNWGKRYGDSGMKTQ